MILTGLDMVEMFALERKEILKVVETKLLDTFMEEIDKYLKDGRIEGYGELVQELRLHKSAMTILNDGI